MRTTTMMALAMLLLTGVSASAGLDCKRVQELNKSGANPADIARTLGITTPDVQACLAGVVEEPVMANPAGKLPIAPQRPAGDGMIRRGPDGQDE